MWAVELWWVVRVVFAPALLAFTVIVALGPVGTGVAVLLFWWLKEAED